MLAVSIRRLGGAGRLAQPRSWPLQRISSPPPRRLLGICFSITSSRWHSNAAVQSAYTDELEQSDPPGFSGTELSVSSVVLRPYQESAIASCLEALSSGLTRIGVSSPTGSGKTTMFMSLIPKVPDQGERMRTLILVSSVGLASQAEGAARRMLGPGYKIEVEQGKRTASGTADVYGWHISVMFCS